MQHKAEIVYQSPETTPDGNSFMTVKKSRGYYYYAERGGVDSVAFILYNRDTKLYGLINESKPPMDERWDEEARAITAFGGSLDMGIATMHADVVIAEVEEEAGIIVSFGNVDPIGYTMVSTQMSQQLHGFIVDVTDTPKTLKSEDELSETVWLTKDEVLENSDWKSIFIIMKAAYKYGDYYD